MIKILYIIALFCSGMLCVDSCQEKIAFASNTEISKEDTFSATVSGTVVFKGQPVRDAAIFLCIQKKWDEVRSEAEYVTSTVSDGSFVFSFTMPKNGFRQFFPVVFVWKQGYALNIKSLKEKLSEFNIQIDLEYFDPVTGIINNENGDAIAGTKVMPVFKVGTIGISDYYIHAVVPGFETVTNTDGSFELTCLSPVMTAFLSMTAEGYARKLIGPIRAGQRDFPFTLISEGRMTGRVFDTISGEPAANIIVRARQEQFNVNNEPYSSITDADGRFLFTNVVPGMYTLYVVRSPEEYPGRVTPLVKNIEVYSSKTTAIPDINLVRGVLLSGQLSFRDTDEPLSDVMISAFVRDGIPQEAYTDSNGTYAVLCIPGNCRVSPNPMNVYDDITMEPRSREFESADRDTIRGLDFTFEKGIPVTVRVLSPEGENVPYALLNGFSVFGASDKLVMYLSSKRERFGLSASSDDLHLRGRASTTDIYPGMVFEILTERYETTSVSGRATDSSGKPIPLAYVEARSKNNSVRFSHFITRSRGITDGHGNFTVDGLILGDENIVIVEKLGYINGEETLNELISGMNKLGDIVLKPTQCWLEGLVMDKHGNPIVGATVHVWNDIFKNRAITVTNSKGQYRLEGLLPVMRTMQVDHADYRGYHGRDIVTSVNRNIVLLGYERYLEGTVTDEQGRPVQGAILYASFPELINKKTITDHNGHYRLEGLSGVTEDISVIHPDFGRSSYYFIPTNGSWDFTLIKPNGFFGGRVVSPDGTPVKDTSIRPVFNDYPSGSDQHASWTFYDEKRFRTDENGQFMIEGIIEGVFSVDLSNKDYHSIIINNIQSSRDDAILVMEKEPARTINDITPQMDVPRDGSPAPVLDISRWINCDPLSLMDLTGKIVVIDFFSKDDPLSCNETRTMEVLHKEYGIFVIGIHEHTEDIEAVQALIAKQGLSYPIAVDTPSKIEGGKGETFDVYGPRRYYHDILIDRDGKFRLNSNAHQMEQKLLDLIANEGR